MANQKPTYALKQPYAGVCVKHVKNKFVITDENDEPLTRVKPGTLLVEADIDINVCTDTDEQIPASGRYFITANTIDPYHIILDILDNTVIKCVGFPPT